MKLNTVNIIYVRLLIGIQAFPSEIPYTWEQIENQDFLPGILSEDDQELLKKSYGI